MPIRRRERNRQRHRVANKHVCGCGREGRAKSTPLSEAQLGSSVRICCLAGNGHLVRRLAEMGFTPGTDVIVLRRAPFADPVEYQVRGYLVSLRHEEAARIRVKPVPPSARTVSPEPKEPSELQSLEPAVTDD